ncbi:U-scoloptoxin(05)-Er1a-like [Macrobrachium rosenbergii]|uniref:U-scoloptoxin(05)-Er1a-like n=1 Tax=Macrobrachium rosenbergii TaxID=79674 RepID=UPI0034D4AE11
MMPSGTYLRLPLPCLFSVLLLCSFFHEGQGISCIQCEADVALGGDDSCVKTPPNPEPCDKSMSVCMTIRTYMPAEQDSRVLVSLVRTCGPTDMGWDCEKGRNDRGQVAEVCHDTCDWDGCNPAPVNHPRSLWVTLGVVLLLCLVL